MRRAEVQEGRAGRRMSLLRAGNDAVSQKVWIYCFPKMQPGWYPEHPNLTVWEWGLNWEVMPKGGGGGGREDAGLADGAPNAPTLGAGWDVGAFEGVRFVQRGGLVPSPGAGL